MSVIRRGSSRNWYIQFQFQGRTYIRSSRTTDRKAAEQMERDMRREIHSRTYLGEKPRITLGDALELFSESKRGTPNYTTLKWNSVPVRRILSEGRPLDELRTADLERLKQEREREGISHATIRHLFNLIRGTCKHAGRLGYQSPDLSYPQLRPSRSRLRYLSLEDEERFLAELDPTRSVKGLAPYGERHESLRKAMWDAWDLAVLLLDTGARYSEIAGLEWKQVALDDCTINLWRPKVQNESVLFMTERVHQLLSRRSAERGGSVHVFQNKKGEKRGYAGQSLRKALRRAGLSGFTIHTLRHTHATRLVQNGVSLYEVKEVLGHTDIKTTMRYAHLDRRDVLRRTRDVIDRLNRSHEKITST